MPLASWFRPSRPSAVKTAPRRQPARPRLRLEALEDRLLLTAGSANQQGFLNNPTVNFNTQAIGLTLPPVQNNPANTGLTDTFVLNPLQSSAAGVLAAPLAQSQLYDQFRVLAVNSQGQGNQPQVAQQFFFMGAFGFGSGVQPNAPWMPAAYSVGLANNQFSFTPHGDMGTPAPPPWVRPTMQGIQHDDGAPRPDDEAQAQPPAPAADDTEPVRLEEPAPATTAPRGDPEVETALFGAEKADSAEAPLETFGLYAAVAAGLPALAPPPAAPVAE